MRLCRSEAEPTMWRSEHDRPRVLVEHHDANVGVAIGNLLAAEGYDVATCTGPTDRRSCPVADGVPCPRAREADVVVFGLEVEDELDREVLVGLKASVAGTPIVVEIPPARVPLYQQELTGCVAVPRPMTRETVLNAVERALR